MARWLAKQKCRAARAQDAIADFGDFKVRRDRNIDALEFSNLLKALQKSSKILIFQGI